MKLTKDNLFDAINKSVQNSGLLYQEGEILFSKKRYARAYSLFQLSIEESGKAMMTYNFLLFDDFENETNQKKFLKNFKSHKFKAKKSINIDLLVAEAIGSKNIKKTLILNAEYQKKHINEINDLKNYSLYTSLVYGKFMLPSEIITKKMSDDLGFYAKIRQDTAKQISKLFIENFDKILLERKKQYE